MFDTLGIDIGAESVKLAVVSGGKLKKTAEMHYPPEYFSDGWVTDPSRMGVLLSKALRENRFRTRSAAVQLAGDVSYVHTASMPVMNAKQLKLNLRFAFTDYISDNLDHYAYDYAMLDTTKEIRHKLANPPKKSEGEDGVEGEGENELTMDFTAVAAPINLLAQIRRTLEPTKLRLDKAAPPECSCIALIRSAFQNDDPQKEYCILDLGSRAIRLYIFRGERHIVTRGLETGMRNVLAPVSQFYRVRQEEARDMYRENYDNCQYLDGCAAVYNDISVELMRTINFYRFSHQDSTVQDVWLIGGGAGVEPLAEVVGRAMDMAVHPASELVPGGGSFRDPWRYAQAVGAALC